MAKAYRRANCNSARRPYFGSVLAAQMRSGGEYCAQDAYSNENWRRARGVLGVFGMGKLIKTGLGLGAVGVIGLLAYGYLVDMTPQTQPQSIDVVLDAK